MKLLVGTDIESVSRFKKLYQEKSSVLEKMFFKSEYEYALNKSNAEQSFTGIWCAKEAVVKSFSQIIQLHVRDVEVICEKDNAPTVSIEKLKQSDIDYNIAISISHSRDYATAVAILTILN